MLKVLKRKAVLIPLLLLIGAGTAFAAWFIYSGGSGAGAGKFGNTTTTDAITFTADPASVVTPLSPGTTGDLALTMTNNDPSASHTITGVTDGVSTSPSECASHITVNQTALNQYLVNVPVAKGTTNSPVDIPGALTADGSLPATCANGSITVTLTATTNP